MGGGYAGITAAKALDDVADVTLVDPTEAFVHNVAAWRSLVEPEWLERIFLPYEHLLANGRFVRDRAVAVDGRRVTLASGEVLEPDYLVLATGSAYPFPAKVEEPDVASARARIRAAHEALLGAERVLIIGAGPAGLELAGEIKAFHPDKQVTIADISPDILAGPYDQALRDELRRQLDALGIELRLGARCASCRTPRRRRSPRSRSTRRTAARSTRTCGSAPSACGRTASTSRAARSMIAATSAATCASTTICASAGETSVFAIGDLGNADRNMAGVASRQAELTAANIRSLITGSGELAAWEQFPPLIAIPLGPEGGSGFLGDGVADPATIAQVKGRDMLIDNYASLFDAAPEEVCVAG